MRAANSPGVRDLIASFYSFPEVEGFALGVHANFVSMFRGEFGRPHAINDILRDSRAPTGWPEACSSAQYPLLSAIYVVMYINISSDDFRSRYPQLPRIAQPDYAIFLETIERFAALADRRKHRPNLFGGISIAAYDPGKQQLAGTLGGFLEETTTGNLYLLSCGHVFLSRGYDVIQQAPGDGGNPSDIVAQTKYEVPFCALTSVFNLAAAFNSVDAAIAELNGSAVTISRSIRLLSGKVTGLASKSAIGLGDHVIFVGKESDYQDAKVHHFVSRIKVDIDGVTHNFGDVFEIRPRATLYIGSLAQPGDSGSWAVQDTGGGSVGQAYGLLFAGTKKAALCCFMETVVDELEQQAQNATHNAVKYRTA